jgi:SAM-dependent methyltransferase
MNELAELRSAAYYRVYGCDGFLRRVLDGHTRVLDVGCADGRGSAVLSHRGTLGVDIYRPALESGRFRGRRSSVVQADVRDLPYCDEAFDVVVALDVVEHFEKPDALDLLCELERVARETVVVATPNGFVAQPPTEDEPWQEHRCGFSPDELEQLGYRVSGVGGASAFRGPYGAFRGGPLGKAAGACTAPFARRRPRIAFALLAVKDLAHPPAEAPLESPLHLAGEREGR